MSSKFKIDLKTANQFWTPRGLGSMGMDPHRAIAELVANALDWRREKEDNIPPIIQIIVNKGSIEVKDNGVGMTTKELQDAMYLSLANDDRRQNLRVRKGMFGMGMKVACLSLGWNLSIRTRSIKEKDKEHTFNLNTRKLDRNEDLKIRDNIYGETISFNTKGSLHDWKSGTSILISDLTNKFHNASLIRDSIQEVFNPEIGIEGVKIEVIDEETGEIYECEKVRIPVLDDYTINLDELNLRVKSDDTGQTKKIRGWIGLKKKSSSGSGKWGLHLFKDNQIIERFHQVPQRLGGLMPKNPHPIYGRVYGEIHLDTCRPAFHKVGFDYTTTSWEKARDLLTDYIKTIFEAADTYKVNNEEKRQEALKKVQQQRKVGKKAVKKLKQKHNDPEKPDNAITLSTGEWFVLVEPLAEYFSENDNSTPWRYHYREESHEVIIIINKGAILYKSYVTAYSPDSVLQIINNWAISECLMLFLNQRFNVDLIDSVKFRNEQLDKLFSIQEEE